MQIDIRAIVRKLIVAGLPLAPAACGRDPLEPAPDGGFGGSNQMVAMVDAAVAKCVGDWKSAPAPMCGQPETELVLLDPTSAKQQQLYEQCISGAGCLPLCKELRPTQNILTCEAACQPPSNRGARLVRSSGCAIGRMTEGVALAEPTGTTLAAHLAELAALEAASVPAFVRLARELAAHGAPAALIAAAQRSAREEVAHQAAMTTVAAFAGGAVAAPGAAALPTRSIEALATENAVEGCVRETFGALLACWQAAAAADPVLRHVMTGIAADETAHAVLGWQIHAWAGERLPGQRRRLRDELHAAFAEVERSAEAPLLAAERDRRAFGVPAPEVAVHLARELYRAVSAQA